MKIVILMLSLLLTGCSSNKMGNVKHGMTYYNAHNNDLCVASVSLQDDMIMKAYIDELTYLSSEEYDGLMTNSEDEQKHLASKRENNEAYSNVMEMNKATHTISENYDAICKYVEGKKVSEIKQLLENRSNQEITDAVSGCTLQSTKGYLEAIVEACDKAIEK